MNTEGNMSYTNLAHRENTDNLPMSIKINTMVEMFSEAQLAGPKDKLHEDNLKFNIDKFFESFNSGYKSVEHMEEILRDKNKSDRVKEAAMNDLDLLGKVVYESLRNHDDFKEIIGRGDASGIDDKLPKEFEGVGKIVLTNVFEKGPVLDSLKNLDIQRASLRRVPEGEAKNNQLKKIVSNTIDEIVNYKNLTTGQNFDREMCLGFLMSEKERLGGEQKTGDNNVDQITSAVNDLVGIFTGKNSKEEVSESKRDYEEPRIDIVNGNQSLW